MPCHHLLEDSFASAVNNVAMTRDNPIEIPATDSLDALIEPRSVPGRRDVPVESFLPQRITLRALQSVE